MKTRACSAAWVGALSGGAVVLTFGLALALFDAHRLRSEVLRLKADATESRRARDVAETELALHREQLTDLRRTVDRLREADEAAPGTGAAPVRARLVRGNQLVGTGWIVSGTNGLTGQPEVSVVVETPERPVPSATEAPATAAAPPLREYRYAYWYQQPLYTWGAVVTDHPFAPCHTNEIPGLAPPPRPAPVVSEPAPAPAAPAPVAPTPALAPRTVRPTPLRPPPVPPVTPRPPPYHITTASTVPRAASPSTAAPAIRATPAAVAIRPGPAANSLPTPSRTQPLPQRSL
jgi:hypothetical protein